MKMIEEKIHKYMGHKLRVRHFDGEFDLPSELMDIGINDNWWCGYVELTLDDPWYGMDYPDIDVNCHGGLTFKGLIDGEMYIGFDCHHYLDNPLYHGEGYCIEECESIIRQMISRDMKGVK